MVDISPRIQRLVVRSFPYQPFDVQYRRGKDIPLADALSRVSPTPVEEDGIQLPIVAVNLITSSIPVSSSEIEMIRGETARDMTLNLLRHYIHVGWPQLTEECCHENFTLSGTTEKISPWKMELITKGARLVIPLHIKKQGVGADTRRTLWALKNVMLKARDCVLAWNFQ